MSQLHIFMTMLQTRWHRIISQNSIFLAVRGTWANRVQLTIQNLVCEQNYWPFFQSWSFLGDSTPTAIVIVVPLRARH